MGEKECLAETIFEYDDVVLNQEKTIIIQFMGLLYQICIYLNHSRRDSSRILEFFPGKLSRRIPLMQICLPVQLRDHIRTGKRLFNSIS